MPGVSQLICVDGQGEKQVDCSRQGWLYCLSKCDITVCLITCCAHSNVQFLSIVKNIIYRNFILLATNKVITSDCIFQLDFAVICGCELQKIVKKWIKGIYNCNLGNKTNCRLCFGLMNNQ